MMRRIFGLLITVLGALMVVLATITLLRPVWLQEFYMRAEEVLSSGALPFVAEAAREGDSRTHGAPEPGKPIGVLEIPRLGLSSVVIEGDEAAALVLGVGHLADTPMPWTRGNSVFAAHRDTFFRPLEHIRRNDIIRFASADGDLEYRVLATKIVASTDVDVLAPTSTSTLTLITCYPFTYIGPAPQRFIVTAERVS
jgi:sortase A